MSNNKSRDDKYFSCEQEHELNYVSGLYAEKEKVYEFLKLKCDDNSIKYSTHDQVYKLIKDELGFTKA